MGLGGYILQAITIDKSQKYLWYNLLKHDKIK